MGEPTTEELLHTQKMVLGVKLQVAIEALREIAKLGDPSIAQVALDEILPEEELAKAL